MTIWTKRIKREQGGRWLLFRSTGELRLGNSLIVGIGRCLKVNSTLALLMSEVSTPGCSIHIAELTIGRLELFLHIDDLLAVTEFCNMLLSHSVSDARPKCTIT